MIKSNFAIFTVLLFVLDIGLRSYGEKKNYAEKNGSLFYKSLYQNVNKNKELHTYTPNTEFKRSTDEFNYYRKINNLGLPECDIPEDKPKNEYRIFTLGDSYTEGVGASKDSSYPVFFEQCLKGRLPQQNIKVYNAGVSGSDLIYMERLFARQLSPLRPDGIIIMLNSSDVWEIATRGGKNRFNKDDDPFDLKGAPLTEMIFASSFIYRHILMDVFEYDDHLMSPEEVDIKMNQSVDIMRSTMGQIENYCFKENIDLFWVVNPAEIDYRLGEYGYLYFKKFIKKARPDLDLLPQMLKRGKKAGLTSTDLFWETDQHCNGRGYQMIGELICNAYTNKFFPNPVVSNQDSTSNATFEANR